MSGLVKGALRLFGLRDAGRHKLPEGNSETAVEVLVEQVAHPQAFQFVHGEKPVWRPEEYRFNIPQGPTGFARVRHYWNAHWRAVAKQFLEPITNLYTFFQRARSLWQPKKRVAQAFNSHIAKQPKSQLGDKAEEGYSAVLARAMEKHFLQGQEEACRLLGLIIIRPVLHSLDAVAAGQLAYGAVDPELLEERLTALLPGLTKTMHLIPFACVDWRTYGHENFEAKFGRDPLAFREREFSFIADYLSTMIPIAFDLCQKGKDQGFLCEALEEKKLLPTMTIGRRLVECLPNTALRFEEEREQALLNGLAEFLDKNDRVIDDGLVKVCEKLFGKRAIDSYFASALKLVPSASKEKKKSKGPKGDPDVLTKAENDAIYNLVSTVLGKLSGYTKFANFAALVTDYFGFVGKALKRLLILEAYDDRSSCRLDLTELLPVLEKAAKEAKSPKKSETDYTAVVDDYFKDGGLMAVENLRKLLHRYPLLLDNLVRLVIHDAIEYFMVDPEVDRA